MQYAATLLVLLAAMVLSFNTTAAQAEPPTKLSPEAEAVVDALRTYNNAMMAQDEKTMSSVQHAVTEGEKKLGEASVRMDMAVGRLKNAATEVFGDKAAAAVGLAVRDISNEEIPHATVTFDGEDKATIGFVAPSPVAGAAVKMIRVDGKWKFDLTQPEGVQDRLAGAAAEYDTRTKSMDQLTASVKARTFDSLDELIQEIGKRAS
jgi:hypothetical protein